MGSQRGIRLEPFWYKPPGMLWAGCQLFVAFGCDLAPEVTAHEVTGLEQFGFVISSTYKIVTARVEEWEELSCKMERCECGVKYRFTVRCFVSEKVGFGIGIGKGTGTAGVNCKAVGHTHEFTTPCMCCDTEGSPKPLEAIREIPRSVPPAESSIVPLAAVGVVIAGLAVAVEHPFNQVANAFVGFSCLAMAGAVLGVGWRWWRRRTSESGASSDGASVR